jgi:hypothetical protein
MFARTLRDELMGNDNWINTHVGNCVETKISREKFLSTVLPLIEESLGQQLSQVDLEKKIAKLAQSNLKTANELSKAIDCINGRVIHEARNRGLPAFEGVYLPLSCALFGRYIFSSCKSIGYIS